MQIDMSCRNRLPINKRKSNLRVTDQLTATRTVDWERETGLRRRREHLAAVTSSQTDWNVLIRQRVLTRSKELWFRRHC